MSETASRRDAAVAGAVARHAPRRISLATSLSIKIARRLPFRPHWLRLDAPVVAFTFDDFPVSAGEATIAVLEAAGMRATFYLAAALMGQQENDQPIADAAMVARLAQHGHEIGAHTLGHVDATNISVAELMADVTRNDREITEVAGGHQPMSFAYPYGAVTIASKLALMRHYAGLRGISRGVNRRLIDLAHLKCIELFDATADPRSVEALLDNLLRRPGWLIFYTHDVQESPSRFGCSLVLFAKTVAAVRRRGIAVEPVIETLARIGAIAP